MPAARRSALPRHPAPPERTPAPEHALKGSVEDRLNGRPAGARDPRLRRLQLFHIHLYVRRAAGIHLFHGGGSNRDHAGARHGNLLCVLQHKLHKGPGRVLFAAGRGHDDVLAAYNGDAPAVYRGHQRRRIGVELILRAEEPGAFHDHRIVSGFNAAPSIGLLSHNGGANDAVLVPSHDGIQRLHRVRSVQVAGSRRIIPVGDGTAQGPDKREHRPVIGAGHGKQPFFLGGVGFVQSAHQRIQRLRRCVKAILLKHCIVIYGNGGVGIEGKAVILPLIKCGAHGAGHNAGGYVVKLCIIVETFQSTQLCHLGNPCQIQTDHIRGSVTCNGGDQLLVQPLIGHPDGVYLDIRVLLFKSSQNALRKYFFLTFTVRMPEGDLNRFRCIRRLCGRVILRLRRGGICLRTRILRGVLCTGRQGEQHGCRKNER